jgi:general secretion pathway protein G
MDNHGFTLIEIMVVIIILGILAVYIGPKIMGRPGEAKQVKPETGNVPTKWKEGGYLEKRKVPKDPWKNDFLYLSPGVHADFDIISYGADGVPGGEGEDQDVNSWEIE